MSIAVRAGLCCAHNLERNRYGLCPACKKEKRMTTATTSTEETKTAWDGAVQASADSDATPRKVGTAELKLECKLSDEELLEKGQELAAELARIDEIEEKASAAAKRFREQRKEHDEAASAVARIVRAKTEERRVACTIFHVLAVGVARTIRDDTGEIVSERPLDYAERQGKLSFDGDESDGEESGDEDADVDAESGRGDLEDQLDAVLGDEDTGTAIADPDALLAPDVVMPPAKKRGRRP